MNRTCHSMVKRKKTIVRYGKLTNTKTVEDDDYIRFFPVQENNGVVRVLGPKKKIL